MAKIGSGMITLTDLTDGELKLSLSSNLSQVQKSNPETGLTPNWETINLVLTPSVTFNGQEVAINDERLSIFFTKKIGSAAETNIDGITEKIDLDKKTLTVNKNNLQNVSNHSITYICHVVYTMAKNSVFSDREFITYSLLTDGKDGKDGKKGDKGDKGDKGEPGANGENAYTIVLSNESHVFPGEVETAAASQTTTSVLGFKGSQAQTVKIKTVDGKAASTTNTATTVTGLTFKVSSIEYVREPVITFTASTAMTLASKTIPIVVEMDGQTFTKNFSFSIAFQGENGKPVSLLTITPSEQVFKSEDGGNTFSPEWITITPYFQNCDFYSWYYSLDGGTNWFSIDSDSSGKCYYDTSTKVLWLNREWEKFTKTNSTASFRCMATNSNIYDIVTIARLYDVTELEAGTRNLLKFTAYHTLQAVRTINNYATFSIDSVNMYNNNYSLKIVTTEGSTISNGKYITHDCWSNLILGAPLRLSFFVKGSVNAKFWCAIQSGTASKVDASVMYDTTTDWTKVVIDFGKVTVAGEAGKVALEFGFDRAGTFYINSMMLEYGTLTSAWSPAPEDVENTITELETSVDTRFTVTEEGVQSVTERTTKLTEKMVDDNGNIIDVNEFQKTTKAGFEQTDRQASLFQESLVATNGNVSKLDSRLTVAEGRIDLSVTEDDLLAGEKVAGERKGTKLQLNSEMVRVSWSGINQYWSFENGSLILYYSSTSKIFEFNDYFLNFFDGSSNNYLLSRFDRKNWVFYSGKVAITSKSERIDSYKVTSIGQDGFRIYNGAQSPVTLLIANQSGIQLNNVSGYKALTIEDDSVTIYNDNGSRTGVQLKNYGIQLYTPSKSGTTIPVRRVGALATNFITGTSNYGLTLDINYETYYLAFASQRNSSATTTSSFMRYTNRSLEGYAANSFQIFVETTITGTLYAKGELHFSSEHSPYMFFNTQSGSGNWLITRTDNSNDCCVWAYGTSAKMQLQPSPGNLLIAGTYYAGGSAVTSDGRIKYDIYDSLVNGLAIIEKLEPREYLLKSNDNYVPVGFIAQEIQEVAPFLVDSYKMGAAEESTYSLKTDEMLWLALKGIKELKQIVDEQKTTIEQLVKENNLILNQQNAAEFDNCIDEYTDYAIDFDIETLNPEIVYDKLEEDNTLPEEN